MILQLFPSVTFPSITPFFSLLFCCSPLTWPYASTSLLFSFLSFLLSVLHEKENRRRRRRTRLPYSHFLPQLSLSSLLFLFSLFHVTFLSICNLAPSHFSFFVFLPPYSTTQGRKQEERESSYPTIHSLRNLRSHCIFFFRLALFSFRSLTPCHRSSPFLFLPPYSTTHEKTRPGKQPQKT